MAGKNKTFELKVGEKIILLIKAETIEAPLDYYRHSKRWPMAG